jgi:acetyl-CoA C-acetyltransferase
MANGIRDRVAIVGMGCSRFGERWSESAEDLMLEAFQEASADAGVERHQIEAAWLGVCLEENNVGKTAGPLVQGLRLRDIPATRVENACATGTEALRGAVYAVASGACDFALALGVEKLKDTGYGGLPHRTRGTMTDLWQPNGSAPGAFAQLASAYRSKYALPAEELKRAMAHVSVKSHENGSRNPKAHLRSRISIEDVLKAPIIASPLGLYDCSGVSDGAACAIVTTPEIARGLGKKDVITVKALQLAVSSGEEAQFNTWDGASIRTAQVASSRAYQEAGIRNPSEALDLIEVHDCFSITELVLMEDLGLSLPGRAPHDILEGRYDRDGAIPCQIDGGLKCFGHPIGASGLRMVYEIYLQLQGRAGERQLAKADLGLSQNLGGHPHQNVCAIAIIGRHGA